MKAHVIIIGLALLVGCSESKQDYANAIRAAIAQDRQAAVELSGNVTIWETLTKVSPEKLDHYVVSIKSIDMSRCPVDFRNAYQAHIRAWEDYVVAYRGGNDRTALKTAIEETWLAVHARARDYGVMDAIKGL